MPKVSVIVCGVAKTSCRVEHHGVGGGGLLRFSGLSFELSFVQLTAARSVPTSVESTVVFTKYDELASYAPISTVEPAFSPPGPRNAPRWSTVGVDTPGIVVEPLSIAGLPPRSAMVSVGPPLLARLPRNKRVAGDIDDDCH